VVAVEMGISGTQVIFANGADNQIFLDLEFNPHVVRDLEGIIILHCNGGGGGGGGRGRGRGRGRR
jgi:hypothetical protein